MQPPIAVGQILADKYRIERVLGEGGMGIVVAATHLQLEQLVAIKFLLSDALQNPEIVARFAREARTLAKLKSEHVGRVIDVSTTEIPGTGTHVPYMVMEYLDGRDLEAELQARGPLPIEESVDYLLQTCEAVAEAHAAGIVHRDLKPANLFLARRMTGGTTVKVLDFGISKSQSKDRRDAGLTKTQALMGSPLYMSPEQLARTRDVDARSDIWALGVILYELVSGKLPFDGDTIAQLVASVLHTPPAALLEARADAPPELAAIIDQCLSKEPEQRFQDVADLARALVPLASTRGARSIERIEETLQKQAPVTLESIRRISIPVSGPQSVMGGPNAPAVLASTASTFSADDAKASGASASSRSQSASRSGGTGKIVAGAIAAVAVAVAVALFVKRTHGEAQKDPNPTAATNAASATEMPTADSANAQMAKSADSMDAAPVVLATPPSSVTIPLTASASATALAVPNGARPGGSHHDPKPPATTTAPPLAATAAIAPPPSSTATPNQPWNVKLK